MSERKKVVRQYRKTKDAIRQRGPIGFKSPIRDAIKGKFYKITDELDQDTLSNLTEEQANKLVEQLKQLEAFIRATKRVK
tara:strand:- start:281 stop:520 length:240 start_codon:yes stop_codon:yes gene_type:complete